MADRDAWEKAESLSKFLAAVAIPVVLGVASLLCELSLVAFGIAVSLLICGVPIGTTSRIMAFLVLPVGTRTRNARVPCAAAIDRFRRRVYVRCARRSRRGWPGLRRHSRSPSRQQTFPD